MTHGGEGAMPGGQPPKGPAAGRGAGPARGRGLLAGRYRLGDHLGDGALGTVWQASDELVGREVAVKEPRLPDGLTADERAHTYALLRQSVRAAARVEHPSVITVHDVLTVEERPWLVLELVRGGSLAATLRRATLGVRQAAHVGLAVAGALRAAHAAGIAHGDVKPGNILFGRERPGSAAGRSATGSGSAGDAGVGRIVLADFGMVHAVDQQRRTAARAATPADTPAGTPGTPHAAGAPSPTPPTGPAAPTAPTPADPAAHAPVNGLEFIAPERLATASPGLEPPADLWALGVVLYVAVEGVSPFGAGTGPATVAAVLDSAPRPPARTGPLTELIGQLLAKDPAARPTAEQAEAALRTVAAAPAPSAPQRPDGAAQPPATGPHGAPGARTGARRPGRPSSLDTLQLRALRPEDPEPEPRSDTTQRLTAIGGAADRPEEAAQPGRAARTDPAHPDAWAAPQPSSRPAPQPSASSGVGAVPPPEQAAYGGSGAPLPPYAAAPGGASTASRAVPGPTAADPTAAGPGPAGRPGPALPGALPPAVPMAAQGGGGTGTGDGAADGGRGTQTRGPWGSVRPKVAIGALGALVVVAGAGVFLLKGPLKDDEAAPPPPTSAAPAPSAPTTTAPSTSGAPSPTSPASERPPLPAGWRLQAHQPLTASVALPKGYEPGRQNATEATWTGGDKRAFTITLKRGAHRGATAAEASEQQITWYRTTEDSAMEDVRTRRHSLDWYGQQARWIELDYRPRGKREARRRLELFVPGAEGRVYQLLVDTSAAPDHRTEQDELFAIARDQLRIDTPANADDPPSAPTSPASPTTTSDPTTPPPADATPNPGSTPDASTASAPPRKPDAEPSDREQPRTKPPAKD